MIALPEVDTPALLGMHKHNSLVLGQLSAIQVECLKVVLIMPLACPVYPLLDHPRLLFLPFHPTHSSRQPPLPPPAPTASTHNALPPP